MRHQTGMMLLWTARAVRGSGPPNQYWLVGSQRPDPRRGARQKDAGQPAEASAGIFSAETLGWFHVPHSEARRRRRAFTTIAGGCLKRTTATPTNTAAE